MRLGLIISAIIYCMIGTTSSVAEIGDPCDCPKLECNTCENQTGLTFYSEKCGDGSRVRSCARPSCEMKDPIPNGCEKAVKKRQPQKEKNREPATASGASRGPEIGKAILIKGTVWLEELSGKRHRITMGDGIHLKDLLITETSAEAKVEFQDGNEIHVQPNSKVKMVEYDMDAGKVDRKTLLNLIKGKVRNKVKNKYQGTDTSYYKVKTRSAVAGVRGTDFVVSFEIGHKEVTKVETLTGAVELANPDQSQMVEVPKGTYASYVVEASSSEVFSDEEISEFVARGYLTPVHKMTAAEIANLDWETEVTNQAQRKTASTNKKASKYVCKSPQAEMNQCYWACQNNPKGEKRCRTDLPQVNCVRRRCDANGNWSDESRLPASFHDQCGSSGVRVAPCDY
ncbi:MAG: FecR domain-containing protein [Bdellovibrionales bacterium]|nr:FecR domain-containing protein [Bdellovibrionales bacterium]